MSSVFDDLVARCENDWCAYIEHDFVRQLATGTLPETAFRYYLKQDYVFLIHFSRAYALAIFKSENLAQMRAAKETLNALLDFEIDMHIKYCQEWGISSDTLQQTAEHPANVAYTRFVIDCGMRGSLADLYAALAPCVIGYGECAKWIMQQSFTELDNNPYRSWIDMYISDEYQAVADAKRQALQNLCDYPRDSARFGALAQQFQQATVLEIDFWQMGLDALNSI